MTVVIEQIWRSHPMKFVPSNFLCIECVTDLDQRSEMIIFKSLLTPFESSISFWSCLGRSENWFESKTKATKLSLFKTMKHSEVYDATFAFSQNVSSHRLQTRTIRRTAKSLWLEHFVKPDRTIQQRQSDKSDRTT